METALQTLFPHERSALLDALRRDMRQELRHARSDPELRSVHLANARMAIRLLEALNPRRRGEQKQKLIQAWS